MNYSASDIQQLLQGKWLLSGTEEEHYLIFKHNTYQSKHRRGTFKVEQDEEGKIILHMSDAHHPRDLHVIDKNTVSMSFLFHGESMKNVYKRDNRLMSKLQVLRAK